MDRQQSFITITVPARFSLLACSMVELRVLVIHTLYSTCMHLNMNLVFTTQKNVKLDFTQAVGFQK